MTMYPSSSTQQPAAICALKSPADAIHILEAVRLGLVPRVTRRLTGHERSMIRPGTVWVWEEEETNMRRWTDGRRWGASRVGGGGFLVYTESSDSISPPPSRADSPSYQAYYGNGGREGGSGTPPRRPEPLVKQTYSTSMTHPVTTKVKKFHVVAYSSKRNPQGDGANPLPLPHQLPNLANIKITPGIWPDWETRRDEYGSRRGPATPHSASIPPAHGHHHSLSHDGVHPHAPPHPPANGPPTPVTATAGGGGAPPYPPPESYRSGSPHAYPPPDARGHPGYDRRYPPYDYPPHPYDMYPPHDRYPYYPPGPRDMPPYGGPPHDYRYDPYYDRMRERERMEKTGDDARSDTAREDTRGRSPPRDPRPWPSPRGYYREPYGPREGDMYGRPPYDYDYRRGPPPRSETGYPTPPPREGEYPPRPRDDYTPFSREGDYPPPPPREPVREGEYPPPREADYPYPPRDTEYYPRDGDFIGGPPRDPDYPRPPMEHERPTSSHQRLGKRPTESRPSEATPDAKRMPSWSPHPNGPGPNHVRHASGGSSHGSLSNVRGGDDMRLNGNSPSNGRSPRTAGSQAGNNLPPSVRESGADLERSRENWGRVPA